MRRKTRDVLIGISSLALTLAFWTLLGTSYGVWERVKSTGLRPELSISDLRDFFLLSLSFMVLSGYMFTAIALRALVDQDRSGLEIGLMSAGLFLAHAIFFMLLIGTSPPSGADAPWVLIGVMGALVAEALAGLIWESTRARERQPPRSK